MYAHFLMAPQFSASGIEREVLAVDSEFNMNAHDTGFRIQFILFSNANPLHPISHYHCGNKKTLLEYTQEEQIDLREQLI